MDKVRVRMVLNVLTITLLKLFETSLYHQSSVLISNHDSNELVHDLHEIVMFYHLE